MVRNADISRVSEIADDAAGTTQYAVYSYLGAGTIVIVAHPAVTGGLTLDYGADGSDGFDQFGRVTDQTWTNAAQTTTFDDFTHTYDRASNRLTRDNELHSSLDEDYTYDGLNRLYDVDRNGSAYQDWTLDALGNWDEFDDDGTVEDREHNAANEIISTDAGANPTHDDAGNMTFDGTLHYTYDAWNRLVKVHDDDSGSPGTPGDLIATYAFDGKNRRIVEDVEAGLQLDNYYNANWQLLETRKDGDVDPLKQYIWDLRYIDAPIVRFHDSDTDGTLDNTLYYTTDANFNVTAVIDNTGAVIERYAYDSYGKVMILDADWSEDADGVSDVDNRTLFTGYHYDSETGLYLARHRIYHPTLGRFIQRDPLGYPDGMNLYQCMLSNPLRWTDSTGMAVDRIDKKGETHFHIYEGISKPNYGAYVATISVSNFNVDKVNLAAEHARLLSIRVSLQSVAAAIKTAAQYAEIAIRIANAPLDIALSVYEFIEHPSLLCAAGILPIIPVGVAKKLDRVIGGTVGEQLRDAVQYNVRREACGAFNDFYYLSNGYPVTKLDDNTYTALLIEGDVGSTMTLRRSKKTNKWTVSIQQRRGRAEDIKIRY